MKRTIKIYFIVIIISVIITSLFPDITEKIWEGVPLLIRGVLGMGLMFIGLWGMFFLSKKYDPVE